MVLCLRGQGFLSFAIERMSRIKQFDGHRGRADRSCRISVSVRGISLILNFKPSSVRDVIKENAVIAIEKDW